MLSALGQLIQEMLRHTFIDPQSPQTRAVSNLFWVGGAVATIILAIPTGVLAYTLTHFRYKPGQGEPRQVYGFTKLEITWTVVPTIIVLFIFALSIHTQGLAEPNTDQPPQYPHAGAASKNTADELTVIGHQWWWELRYASGVVTANEIHIPTHTAWTVALTSADVVHGFWIPQIGNQMYLIPGQTTHVYLEADRPGVYYGQCAEFCGAQHAWMLLRVIAQPPAQYDAWVRDQLKKAPAAPAPPRTVGPPPTAVANVAGRTGVPATGSNAALFADGARLFQQLSCQSCHAIAGTAANADVGPDLTHVGSRETIAAGRLDNTPANMMAWLRDPQQFKSGSHMPDLLLTPSQIQALTTYLEGLK